MDCKSMWKTELQKIEMFIFKWHRTQVYKRTTFNTQYDFLPGIEKQRSCDIFCLFHLPVVCYDDQSLLNLILSPNTLPSE